MRIVVIGGVAAGMSAASRAKLQAPDAEVLVLERGRHVSYGACGLPYNILATALHAGMTVDQLESLDLAYAPPLAPVYDPLLIAAAVARKELSSPVG